MKQKSYLTFKIFRIIIFTISSLWPFFYTHAEGINPSLGRRFIHDLRHNPKMDITIRKMLIEKGYRLLHLIEIGETLPQEVEIFKDGGRAFAVGKGMRRKISFKTLTESLQKISSKTAKEKIAEYDRRRQAQLENLIAIAWALADYASQRGQGFDSGSFSIIDPKENLFKIFYKYVQFASKLDDLKRLSPGTSASINPFSNAFAYNRHPNKSASSHYKKGLTTYQFGIDARFERNAYSLPVLPYMKKHLLVGRVKTMTDLPKTFVKYEFHGTADIGSAVAHGLKFIHSKKNRENRRSEKDILKSLMKPFLGLQSLLDAQQPSSLQDMKNRLNSLGVSSILWEKMLNDREGKRAGKDYDVSSLALMAFIAAKTLPNEKVKNAAKEFLSQLELAYCDGDGSAAYNLPLEEFNPANHKVFYRSGNEVVLNLATFVRNENQLSQSNSGA